MRADHHTARPAIELSRLPKFPAEHIYPGAETIEWERDD